MLGYTRIGNGLCAICRWSKNSEVNCHVRDKKITPGGVGVGRERGMQPLMQGSFWRTDCHSQSADWLRNDRERIVKHKKDGLPEQSIF